MKNGFPPLELSDLDRRSAGNLLSLKRCFKGGRDICIVLGAGVSSSAGIPTWQKLLYRICYAYFYNWPKSKKRLIDVPPTKISIAITEESIIDECTPEYSKISKELATGNPLLIAQQIKNCIREADWRYLLHKLLYSEDTFSRDESPTSPLIVEISNLCKMGNIQSIINYNYDNLVKSQLDRDEVSTEVLWKGKKVKTGKKLPIFHPHGYLPFSGGPKIEIVLAENDYHQEFVQPYSWGNLIQSKAFLNSHCVFVGLSMGDPNLRRMLRSTRCTTEIQHFCFLFREKRETVEKTEKEILFDYDLSSLGVKVIRVPKRMNNSYSRLPELLNYIGA